MSIGKTVLIALGAMATTVVVLMIFVQELIQGDTTPIAKEETTKVLPGETLSVPPGDIGISTSSTSVTEAANSFLHFTDDSLGVSFSYPAAYGNPVVDYEHGAKPGTGYESVECRSGSALATSVACTAARIMFVNGTQTKPFMVFHGIHMNLLPQGGWWGLQKFDDTRALLTSWSENPVLFGEPNLKLYRVEMGGDTRTQFARSGNQLLSHIVVASPLEMAMITPGTQEKFKQHLQTMPPAPPYRPGPEWSEEFLRHRTEVEMFDASADEGIQEYLSVLRSVRFGP